MDNKIRHTHRPSKTHLENRMLENRMDDNFSLSSLSLSLCRWLWKERIKRIYKATEVFREVSGDADVRMILYFFNLIYLLEKRVFRSLI